MKAELKKDLLIEFPRPCVSIPRGSELEIVDIFDYNSEMYIVFRFEGFTYIKEKEELNIEVIV